MKNLDLKRGIKKGIFGIFIMRYSIHVWLYFIFLDLKINTNDILSLFS